MMIATWLSLALGAALAIASACFLFGRVYTKTSSLEQRINEVERKLEELSSKVSALKGSISTHYMSSMKSDSTLVQKMTSLHGQVVSEIETLRKQIGELTKEIRMSRRKA